MSSLVEYVQQNWDQQNLIHLAAFVMWRLNWIHPFENGNGRTARAAAYLALSAKHGNHLPAKNTIILQIIANKEAYYQALRDCDAKNAAGAVDYLANFENFVAFLLKEQLRASLP
jgi:Fic family protein